MSLSRKLYPLLRTGSIQEDDWKLMTQNKQSNKQKTNLNALFLRGGYSLASSVILSVYSVHRSVNTFCMSRTISQYLLVRFDSLVKMISTMDSRYPISLVKIDPLTLELLPLFWYRQL